MTVAARRYKRPTTGSLTKLVLLCCQDEVDGEPRAILGTAGGLLKLDPDALTALAAAMVKPGLLGTPLDASGICVNGPCDVLALHTNLTVGGVVGLYDNADGTGSPKLAYTLGTGPIRTIVGARFAVKLYVKYTAPAAGLATNAVYTAVT
jgi:hypothetical protein